MTALLAVRLLLALVLAAAAAGKLRDRTAFRQTLAAFGVPDSLAGPMLGLVPLAELAAALLLLPLGTARLAATLSLVLLALFTLAVVVNLARGHRPPCACFGSASASPIGADTVVRNVVLMMAAGGIMALGPGPSLGIAGTWWTQGTELERALLVVAGVLIVLTLALAWYANELRIANERLQARVQALDQQASSTRTVEVDAGGLAPGTIAPTFDLPKLEGDRASLQGLLQGGRPLLLVFSDALCPSCHQLWPDIARWQSEQAHTFTVAAICSGSDQTIEMKVMGSPVVNVLLEGTEKVGDAYGLTVRPSAVFVGADGRILSRSVAGPSAIRNLVASTRLSGTARTPD